MERFDRPVGALNSSATGSDAPSQAAERDDAASGHAAHAHAVEMEGSALVLVCGEHFDGVFWSISLRAWWEGHRACVGSCMARSRRSPWPGRSMAQVAMPAPPPAEVSAWVEFFVGGAAVEPEHGRRRASSSLGVRSERGCCR